MSLSFCSSARRTGAILISERARAKRSGGKVARMGPCHVPEMWKQRTRSCACRFGISAEGARTEPAPGVPDSPGLLAAQPGDRDGHLVSQERAFSRIRTLKYGQRFAMENAAPGPSRDGRLGAEDLKESEQSESPTETRIPGTLTVGERSVCLYSKSSDHARLSHPVSLTAWPRSLIACASELQALSRPVNYSAFSYLYLENQQWGEVVRAGERWARLFRPDMPGGHACFILSGRALFEGTFVIEVFDESPGSFSVEIYDEGSCRYVPVGTVELTGSKEWKVQTFPVPSVLPGRWGYLCHLLPSSLSGPAPIARLGVGRAETIASQLLVADTDFGWHLRGSTTRPASFTVNISSPSSHERDFFLRAVTLESQQRRAAHPSKCA